MKTQYFTCRIVIQISVRGNACLYGTSQIQSWNIYYSNRTFNFDDRMLTKYSNRIFTTTVQISELRIIEFLLYLTFLQKFCTLKYWVLVSSSVTCLFAMIFWSQGRFIIDISGYYCFIEVFIVGSRSPRVPAKNSTIKTAIDMMELHLSSFVSHFFSLAKQGVLLWSS